MQANELRIGNWVNEFGKPKQIHSVDILYLEGEDDTDFGDMYEPIPLTPEILEKCGLKQYENFIEIKGQTIGVIFPVIEIHKEDWEPEYQAGTYVYSGLGDPESYGFKVKIEYLHQLQNLYFALTGEELQINL
jgi:hypothetical protein